MPADLHNRSAILAGAWAGTLDRANSDVVLIVDDVPDNLSVLHDALDESGYTVLVATSGEAALQRAAQAVPDIILLDAMMPGMDGFEVARRLKASGADGKHSHRLHDRSDRDRIPGGSP
jgi:CheY-like chemotaxis protein